MSDAEAKAMRWYAGLASQGKPEFLALWAHNVTVAARAWYPGQAEEGEAIAKLVACNEIQHVLTIELTHLLAEDRFRRPDEVVVAHVFDTARRAGCDAELLAAFGYTMPAFQSRREGQSPPDTGEAIRSPEG